jgi:hypothetical protein
MVERADLELDNDKIGTMQHLQVLIDKAKADGSDASIVHAYQKMLAKYI